MGTAPHISCTVLGVGVGVGVRAGAGETIEVTLAMARWSSHSGSSSGSSSASSSGSSGDLLHSLVVVDCSVILELGHRYLRPLHNLGRSRRTGNKLGMALGNLLHANVGFGG